MYFAPAALATDTQSLALKFVGLNCRYKASYSLAGTVPPGSPLGPGMRDQPISVPFRLMGPQWMNMPKRLSCQFLMASGGADGAAGGGFVSAAGAVRARQHNIKPNSIIDFVVCLFISRLRGVDW